MRPAILMGWTLVIAIVLAFFFGTPVSAQEPRDGVRISSFIGVENRSILDPGITPYSQPVLNLSTTAIYPNGWGINVFHSTGLGSCFENEACGSQETDPLEVFYTKRDGNWSALVKASYFALGPIKDSEGDVVQLKLRVEYQGWKRLFPYVDTNYQVLIGDSGGLALTHLGVRYAVPIGERWSVAGYGDLTYDSAPFQDNGFLGRGELGLWRQMTPKLSVGAWTKLRTPFSRFKDTDRQGWAFGLGANYNW